MFKWLYLGEDLEIKNTVSDKNKFKNEAEMEINCRKPRENDNLNNKEIK